MREGEKKVRNGNGKKRQKKRYINERYIFKDEFSKTFIFSFFFLYIIESKTLTTFVSEKQDQATPTTQHDTTPTQQKHTNHKCIRIRSQARKRVRKADEGLTRAEEGQEKPNSHLYAKRNFEDSPCL